MSKTWRMQSIAFLTRVLECAFLSVYSSTRKPTWNEVRNHSETRPTYQDGKTAASDEHLPLGLLRVVAELARKVRRLQPHLRRKVGTCAHTPSTDAENQHGPPNLTIAGMRP